MALVVGNLLGIGGAKHPNPIFYTYFYPLKPNFHRF